MRSLACSQTHAAEPTHNDPHSRAAIGRMRADYLWPACSSPPPPSPPNRTTTRASNVRAGTGKKYGASLVDQDASLKQTSQMPAAFTRASQRKKSTSLQRAGGTPFVSRPAPQTSRLAQTPPTRAMQASPALLRVVGGTTMKAERSVRHTQFVSRCSRKEEMTWRAYHGSKEGALGATLGEARRLLAMLHKVVRVSVDVRLGKCGASSPCFTKSYTRGAKPSLCLRRAWGCAWRSAAPPSPPSQRRPPCYRNACARRRGRGSDVRHFVALLHGVVLHGGRGLAPCLQG